MTTISRVNTTISNHLEVAHYIALSLLVAGIIVGAAAISQTGQLAHLYDSAFRSTPITETTASKAQVTPQTSATDVTVANSSPLLVQNQPKDVISQVQPAPDTAYNAGETVNNLQPSANGMQLTGVNPQNAAASIQ